jgi:hypothetical protein
MALEKLTHKEKDIVLTCLRAIADGPFIKNDWELHSRIGVHRSILNKLIKRWPKIDDSVDDSDETLAINGAMNVVCYGIPFSEVDWREWFKVDRDTVTGVFEKWRNFQANGESGESF